MVIDLGIGPDLAARLDALPELADRTAVAPLPGGLTNCNLKVITPRGPVVARLSSPGSALLAIDRDVERVNSVAAAASGAAPEVVAYDAAARVLVVRFVEGSTWTDADVLEPANAPRIAQACRVLHAGPRFANTFDMLALQPAYRAVVRQHGFRVPDGYDGYAAHAAAIADALAARPVPTVPCNNDLLAANVIDAGHRLWLIDYEYSGNNDPFFEIGNLWSEAAGSVDDLARLVEAYAGRVSRALTARARLWGLMSKYGWMLWAAIQDGTSDLDFDFWSWGMEKYDRAVAEFEGPDFGRLLDETRGGD